MGSSAGGGLGMAMGLASPIFGALGARRQRRESKRQRQRIEQREGASIEELRKIMAGYRENPLLQALGGFLQRELGAAPSPESRRAMYGFTTGQVADLFNRPYGLSDPRVRENIFQSALEGTLQPQYERLRRDTESQFAARGLGRSGLASAAEREQGYRFARQSADLRRQIETQGALQALTDQLAKIGAANRQLGIGQGMAQQAYGGAGGYGFGMQGALGELARTIAGVRGQTASLLAGQPAMPNVWGSLAGGLGGMASPFMQYGLGMQNIYGRILQPYANYDARWKYGY